MTDRFTRPVRIRKAVPLRNSLPQRLLRCDGWLQPETAITVMQRPAGIDGTGTTINQLQQAGTGHEYTTGSRRWRRD